MKSPPPWKALGLLLLAACSNASAPPPDDAATAGAPDAVTQGSVSDARSVAAVYASMCASCHGEVGEGGSGPTLQGTTLSEAALVQAIDARMPLGNATACRGACAVSLAAFIRTRLTPAATACTTVPPSPRALRPLNRREYVQTVRDLFAPALDPATTPTGGASCNTQRFVYAPQGRSLRSVHLAGSFNGWSPSAWPMQLDAATSQWTLSRTIPNGEHTYKFVLDGAEWVPDPRNPSRAPDGFGGFNSVLRVACADAPPTGPAPVTLPDLSAVLPLETRPQGYAFDTHGAATAMTAVHVDAHLQAGSLVAQAIASRVMRLVPCDPSGGAACAEQFVRAFGRRAFRRPLTEPEVVRYRTVVTSAPRFEAGVRRALRAMLLSPSFVYRSELGVAAGAGRFRLTGYEVASALSYGLWSTMPDAALLDAAAAGRLDTPEGVATEARRMLDDPRARETLGLFALQWLGVESLPTLPRSVERYPGFTDAVRASMLEEARRFVVGAVLDGSHRFAELMEGPRTALDPTLAAFYGVAPPSPSGFAPYTWTDGRRAGVLGLGAVLARYAHSDQTSPIQRGVFVRSRLLCQEFPPPPANAGGVPDVDPRATTRERYRQHTANPACASCHQHIDDLGFGLERFDAVGRWRDAEGSMPVDARGVLRDVEGFGSGGEVAFDTVPALGRALAQSAAAEACFVRQYYRFARGFHETALDRCAVSSVAAQVRARGGDLRELLVAVYTAPDFAARVDGGAQ